MSNSKEAPPQDNPDVLGVKRTPPFPKFLRGNLLNTIDTNQPLTQQAPGSIAWQLLRWFDQRNPYFVTPDPDHPSVIRPTGLEGYFVANVEDPAQVFEKLLEMGRRILKSLLIEFRNNYGSKKRLLAALDGTDQVSKKELAYWDEVFGATLARMKAEMLLSNPRTQKFRDQTYACLKGKDVGTVIYETDKIGNVTATYNFPKRPPTPADPELRGNRPKFNLETAVAGLQTDEDRLAWKIISRIGMLGDSGVRAALRHAWDS